MLTWTFAEGVDGAGSPQVQWSLRDQCPVTARICLQSVQVRVNVNDFFPQGDENFNIDAKKKIFYELTTFSNEIASVWANGLLALVYLTC